MGIAFKSTPISQGLSSIPTNDNSESIFNISKLDKNYLSTISERLGKNLSSDEQYQEYLDQEYRTQGKYSRSAINENARMRSGEFTRNNTAQYYDKYGRKIDYDPDEYYSSASERAKSIEQDYDRAKRLCNNVQRPDYLDYDKYKDSYESLVARALRNNENDLLRMLSRCEKFYDGDTKTNLLKSLTVLSKQGKTGTYETVRGIVGDGYIADGAKKISDLAAGITGKAKDVGEVKTIMDSSETRPSDIFQTTSSIGDKYPVYSSSQVNKVSKPGPRFTDTIMGTDEGSILRTVSRDF